MYNKKFVGCIKVNGKILREHVEEVRIPFGSEYSILLKNLSSVKAVVTISIDGTDVLNGNSIIVNSNQSVDVEGFLRGMLVSNKFKFIQKTKDIQDYRGDKVDDGIVRIEYKFEKIIDKKTVIVEHHDIYHHNYFNYPWINYRSSDVVLGSSRGSASSSGTGGAIGANNCTTHPNQCYTYTSNVESQSVNCCVGENSSIDHYDEQFSSQPLMDEGITVKGGQSNQSFNYGYVGELEDNSEVIILKLVGTTSKGTIVKEPLFTNKKIKCDTCGVYVETSARFCKNCGTSLV